MIPENRKETQKGMEQHKRKLKCELYHDSMQNWKSKPIQKAQLIIADVPYNIGNQFYGSNPVWYNGGDNSKGESKFAKKAAFNSDYNFNLYEYFHFCSQLMKKEPKRGGGKRPEFGCSLYDCVLQFPTTIHTDQGSRKTRLHSLHTINVYQEIQSSGIKGKYADCRSDREGIAILPGLFAEVSQRGGIW